MRNSEGVRTLWKNFIALHTFPAAESNLTLQLLLDQMLKAMLKNEAQASAVISSSTVPPLSPREKNAVRYMAGYVVISLLRKFKRPVKKPVLQEKYRIFITVLSQLKAEHQPTEIDSLSDYTRLWSELIDRGGLYHVSDKVFELIEAVEMVVRGHLHVSSVSSQSSDKDHSKEILKDALNSRNLLEQWEQIADSITLQV